MTFTEAALEVLKSAGKPLHYKKITEIAIERNLLSHVGKTPEVTMSARLATMVKMGRGNAPITKVRPGVFTIRDSYKPDRGSNHNGNHHPPNGELANDNSSEEDVSSSIQNGVLPLKPVALPGADIFPEEEDDDELILADYKNDEESQDENKIRRRRRRRRRSIKDDGLESLKKDGSTHTARERERFNTSNEPRKKLSTDHQTANDWNRLPNDGELLGKDLADAVWTVLMRSERHPVTFIRAAELLVRRGRLAGHAAALAPTIAAAIRADVSRSEISGSRARFRLRNNRVELTDWLLPREVIRAEETVIRSAERQREQVRRGLIHKLNELPTASFAELIATWLNAEGVVSLRAVRRPGNSGSQLHFAGTLRRSIEESRLAIVVQRDGKGIDRERVIDVRGALHHYGSATSAWLVTTGRVISGAWEEAAVIGATPCVLFDGAALANAMEHLGIGIRRNVVTVTNIDYDLFDSLGDRGEVRARSDVEQDRERNYRTRRNRSRTDGPNTSKDIEGEKFTSSKREDAVLSSKGQQEVVEDDFSPSKKDEQLVSDDGYPSSKELISSYPDTNHSNADGIADEQAESLPDGSPDHESEPSVDLSSVDLSDSQLPMGINPSEIVAEDNDENGSNMREDRGSYGSAVGVSEQADKTNGSEDVPMDDYKASLEDSNHIEDGSHNSYIEEDDTRKNRFTPF